MPTKLRKLVIDRIDLCRKGANPDAHVALFKSVGLEKAQKTENGMVFPAEAYAHVPDPEKPSTWKMRLWETPEKKETRRQVGMAMAAMGEGFRGNKVDIPSGDMVKVKAKVRAAWRKTHASTEFADMPPALKTFIGKMSDYTDEALEFDDIVTRMGMQDVSDEICQTISVLHQSMMDILHRSDSAEMEQHFKNTVSQFKQHIEEAMPLWLKGKTVFKMENGMEMQMDGAKLKKLKRMMQEMIDMLSTHKEVEKMSFDRNSLSAEAKEFVESLEAKLEKLEDKIDKARELKKKYDELVEKADLAEKKVKDLESQVAKQNVDPEEEFKKSLPESVRKRLEASEQRAKQAEEEVKKFNEARAKEQYIAKAKEYGKLPIKSEELGLILKSVAEKDAENYVKLEELLKAANEQIKAGDLFKEKGTASAGGATGNSAYEKLSTMAQEIVKSDSKVTFYEAFEMALKRNPDLYKEYVEEGAN